PGLAYRLERAGVTWTPDHPDARWPASGSPRIPADGAPVAIFDRGRERFVSAPGGGDLTATITRYTGDDDDRFTLERVGPGLVAFKASNGAYVSAACETDALTPIATDVGPRETFRWIERPNGDVVLRSVGGGGHLVRSVTRELAGGITLEILVADADHAGVAETNYVILDGRTPQVAPAAPASATETTPAPGPFDGRPHAIPGTIQFVDFDHGGEGVAYHDSAPDNIDGFHRPREGVDIQASSEGGSVVAWIEDGEWLRFTVDVERAGRYRLDVRHAGGEGTLRIEFDDRDVTGDLRTTSTANWQDWTDSSVVVELDAGVQEMHARLGAGYNLRSATFTKIDD
ncbi:MAG: carbohydrate-binding protein, partial [Phycisphaeraceae bacterium]|nr:carbohydrate-binding protein [Phycisphaeraceae bacterium]